MAKIAKKTKRYPSDLTDEEWERTAPLTCAREVLKNLSGHDSMRLSPREVWSWHGVGSDRSN